MFITMRPNGLINRLRTIAALIVSVILATAAIAHDTWLIPDRFLVEPNSSVLLDLTSGMAFPSLETSIKPERIDSAKCRLAGRTVALSDLTPGPKSLRFKARLSDVGMATLWIELKPRALELTPKQVQEYLDEIEAPLTVRQQWASAKGPRHWREVYTKHAKTFVQVGESQADSSWSEPVGMSLEIVPETDPTRLRSGDEFAFRVLENGAPLADFPIGFVPEESDKPQIRRTDKEGRVRYRLAMSGRWLLRGTKLRKATQPGVDWESDFTTLTVRVN